MLLMIACRTSVHLPLLGKTVVIMGVGGTCRGDVVSLAKDSVNRLVDPIDWAVF